MAISCIILSGGRATRMGGIDKGLALLRNKPLIEHVISRVAPQVDEVIINANREIAQYKAFGLLVLQDENDQDTLEKFIGPLAGFVLGLQHAKYDYVLTVPCDSPFLPLDLADRLSNSMADTRAHVAIASSDSNAHHVFCLMKKSVLPSLQAYILSGGRKVSAWQKSLNYVEVDFSDNSQAFINLNTFEDLADLTLTLNKT